MGLLCPVLTARRTLVLSLSGLFRQSQSWTLALTPHSKPRRLAVRRTPAGLLPCRSPAPTRKKSLLAPITPFSLAPEHRRRSHASCRTRPFGERCPSLAPSAGERTEQPWRTEPTARERSSGPPSPTNASVSRTPGADEPLEK